jgi:hypothetical protein
MHKRRMISALTVSATLVLGGVALAAPASATDCPSGYTCIWGDSGYKTGTKTSAYVGFQNYIANFTAYNYAGTSINANDSASSVSNNGTSSTVYLYKNANKSSLAFSLARGTGDGDLSDSSGYAPAGYNDELSSGYYSAFVN